MSHHVQIRTDFDLGAALKLHCQENGFSNDTIFMMFAPDCVADIPEAAPTGHFPIILIPNIPADQLWFSAASWGSVKVRNRCEATTFTTLATLPDWKQVAH